MRDRFHRKIYEPMSANFLSSKMRKSYFLLNSCKDSITEASKSSMMSTCVYKQVHVWTCISKERAMLADLHEADIWTHNIDNVQETRFGRNIYADT